MFEDVCLLLSRLDLSVYVYCTGFLNEQGSIFVSVVRERSSPVLGNPGP